MSATRRRLHAGNALLALTCLGLAVLIYRGIDRDHSAPLPPERRPQVSLDAIKRAETRAAAADVFRPAPITAYDEIVARPLFHSTRRPVAEHEDPRRAGAASDSPLYLTGIVMEGGRTAAFFKVKDAPQMVRVAPGGAVDGWIVEAIDADSVVVAKKGKRERLTTKAVRAGAQPVSAIPTAKPKNASVKHQKSRRKQHENRE